jgi:pre-mRNA-splicing factor 38B
LMDEVIRRERAKHAATGKDYAQRPASYKGSLSLKQDRYTYRKKSKSRSPPPVSRKPKGRCERSRSPEIVSQKKVPTAELLEKRRKLLEQYGDASANASGTL